MVTKEKTRFDFVFYYKVLLLVFLIPTLLVSCVAFNYRLLAIMLGLGAICLLYDFFTARKFLKARGMFWLVCFMITFALSVALNYKTGFKLNVSSWAYTAIALLLLYPDTFGKSKERSAYELSVLNNIFIGMTTVLSTVSMGMFLCLYHKEFVFGDQKYSMGWVRNRLFGLYGNTGYMITAIALALIIVQVAVTKARGKKIGFLYGFFLIYTAAMDFMCMCLENAKGAFISLATFAFIAAFFAIIKILGNWEKRKMIRKVTVGAVVSALSVAVLFGAITVSRKGLSYMPSIYHALGGSFYVDPEHPEEEPLLSEQDGEELTVVDMDRDIQESYGFFTGRTIIWKFGLEQFKQKPVFGYGPQSHRGYFIVDNYLRHFHNLIIQTMVSVGIVGSVFIFAFFGILCVCLVKNIFAHIKSDDRYYYVYVSLLALLGMFIMNSMAEVTILYLARFSMFLFWMYFGYIQVFADDMRMLKTDEIMQKTDVFIGNTLKKLVGKKQDNEK